MREAIITFSILFFIMFFYSGVTKITSFNDKVGTLYKKLDSRFPIDLLNFGMICVILLEIIGPIIIIARLIEGEKSSETLKNLSDITFYLFITFLIVVTLLYHPFSADKPIPFLSNLSTFSGMGLMFIISNMDV
jgi:hypothetical protein